MNKSDFQFVKPYLKEVSMVKNAEFESDEERIGISNSFGININKCENENKANVELLLEINKDMENVPFQLTAVIASDFKWENGIDEKNIDTFLNVNSPALLLAYLRPIVASLTNSAGFQAYNLPFIDFTKQ